MKNYSLVITSIAPASNSVLKYYAETASKHNVSFIVIGDEKSPSGFFLPNCDFYSINQQNSLGFKLAKLLPRNHYVRKNLGYLIAMQNGTEVIIETDDDNIPLSNSDKFWSNREKEIEAMHVSQTGWTNVYNFFTDKTIWNRGFSLRNLHKKTVQVTNYRKVVAPIQQGLVEENPDVDAIFRLSHNLPVRFNKGISIACGENSISPFNSQNTTWFKDAFPLMYLPSFCSFRMTDIWRSFIAQRIAWTCGWSVLFHESTLKQLRNAHDILKDFEQEIPGYLNNDKIMDSLIDLDLRQGSEHIFENTLRCYREMVRLNIFQEKELSLLDAWFNDIAALS